jgi:hypothetical protein
VPSFCLPCSRLTGTPLDRPTHHANVATPYCPALDMKLFPRLTVGEAQHGDSRIASIRKPGSLISHLS